MARDSLKVYATELGAPLVERSGTDAQFTAYLWHRQAGFNAFEGNHDLAVGKS